MRKVKPAIAVCNLCFSYPDKWHVLQNLSLTIQPGERVGLIGPNGAGKTTFFLLICGVLQPTAGEIVLWDKPVVAGEFRPEVGLVFQNPNDQLFSASVRDDVAFGPENLGLSPAEVDDRVQAALSLTGVLELAARVPHHLSGGEKRMVAIASVLAMHPQLVIYDEPSANLDLRARRRLIDFLQDSNETLVISSHDLELILELCDRVLLLDQGQIVADGPPQEVMADWQLMQEHGLETPVSGGSAPRSLALPGNAGSAWERTTSGHSPSFPGSAWER
ncbi:MAG: ABC transporter ATP-binding protein [Hormoscilla sp. SP12CHS1]|nr:ABC transporter ATP-binding protein [Hormoscilla sp. SP12CHS1]